jgi:hypothetical protein
MTALKLGALVALAMATVLPVGARDVDRLEFPGDFPGPPFYARLQSVPLEANGWVAIPFIRDPAHVRPGFNLLLLVDVPWAFFTPLTSEGFVVQDESGDILQAVTNGVPGMPVWFVASAEFAAAGGAADFYREELHLPGPGRPSSMIDIVSRGTVGADRFSVHFVEANGTIRVRRIELK